MGFRCRAAVLAAMLVLARAGAGTEGPIAYRLSFPAPEHRWIARKSAPPKGVAENGHGGSAGMIVIGRQGAPQNRVGAQDGKEITGDR